jgi:chromosome segregation ATPase
MLLDGDSQDNIVLNLEIQQYQDKLELAGKEMEQYQY